MSMSHYPNGCYIIPVNEDTLKKLGLTDEWNRFVYSLEDFGVPEFILLDPADEEFTPCFDARDKFLSKFEEIYGVAADLFTLNVESEGWSDNLEFGEVYLTIQKEQIFFELPNIHYTFLRQAGCEPQEASWCDWG